MEGFARSNWQSTAIRKRQDWFFQTANHSHWTCEDDPVHAA